MTNIDLQAGCGLDGSEHLSIAYNRRALRHVLNALAPATAKPVACTPVAPFAGG